MYVNDENSRIEYICMSIILLKVIIFLELLADQRNQTVNHAVCSLQYLYSLSTMSSQCT